MVLSRVYVPWDPSAESCCFRHQASESLEGKGGRKSQKEAVGRFLIVKRAPKQNIYIFLILSVSLVRDWNSLASLRLPAVTWR